MAKLLDVTLREAGIANGFTFSPEQILETARSLDRAGLDFIEIGYLKRPRVGDVFRVEVCDERYLRKISQVISNAKMVVMARTDESGPEDYKRAADNNITMVRLLVSEKSQTAVQAHAAMIRNLGMRFTLNAVRSTELSQEKLLRFAALAQELGADAFYIADSNGSLYPDALIHMLDTLRSAVAVPIGFHGHDNIRMAFANAITSLQYGVEFLDASIGGSGKGGGNLITELIAGYFNLRCGTSYDIFELSKAYLDNVRPTLKQTPGLCENISGLLDLNIDQIEKLETRAVKDGLSLGELLASVHARSLNLAPRSTSVMDGRVWGNNAVNERF